MRYAGGKKLNGKEIIRILNEDIKSNSYQAYIEPFMGALGITRKVEHKIKLCSDLHRGLAGLYNDIAHGEFVIPHFVTEEEYGQIRWGEYNSLHVLVGFTCSWGGTWWGGYVRTPKDPIEAKHAGSLSVSLINTKRDVDMCFDSGHVSFLEMNYKEIAILDNCIIYCDPPYKGTKPYHCDKQFDHDAFWDWVRLQSQSNRVYVSEYQAPDDFESVWSKDTAVHMKREGKIRSVEHLFKIKE